MVIAARLPGRRRRSRVAKIRFAAGTAWKELKVSFAAGAGAAAVAFAGRKRMKASAEIEERHEPAPFPDRPPLRPASENGDTSQAASTKAVSES